MPTYLVERYLPGLHRSELLDSLARVEAEAVSAQARGIDVRYLGSTFVTDEETCLCTFTAESAAAVRQVSSMAGVPLARVVAAEQIDPNANTGPGKGLAAPRGTQTSLLAKLYDAEDALAAGNTAAACTDLASFVSETSAQSGKKIASTDASRLISEAQQIEVSIPC